MSQSEQGAVVETVSENIARESRLHTDESKFYMDRLGV